MTNQHFIRPIAICICHHQDKILVIDWYDHVKQQAFYRPAGGGIHFQETGVQALQREFWEEFHTHLQNIRFLCTIENIFTFENQPGHEIVLVYDGEFEDSEFYNRDLDGSEDDAKNPKFKAIWKSLGDIRAEQRPLYPNGLYDYLLTYLQASS